MKNLGALNSNNPEIKQKNGQSVEVPGTSSFFLSATQRKGHAYLGE